MKKLLLILIPLAFTLLSSGQIVFSTFTDPTGKYSTTSSGICLGCSITNTSNVADISYSNYATIVISAGLAVSRGIRAKLPSVVPGNTRAGFYVDIGGVVSGLPSVSLTTYKSGSARETIITSGNIVSLLGGSLGYVCASTNPLLDYDEVGISFTGGALSVGLSADVYYAFGGGATCPTASLPVKLIDISVQNNNDIPLITWKTIEDNNSVYNLQRSYNGVSFTTIHTESSSTNKSSDTFSFADTNASEDLLYYRVEVFDKNSLVSFFSKTITINRSANRVRKGITVFPNPVNENTFTITLSSDYRAQYKSEIIDGSGRIAAIPILTKQGQVIRATLHKQLPAGIYTVVLFNISNKQTSYARIIIIP